MDKSDRRLTVVLRSWLTYAFVVFGGLIAHLALARPTYQWYDRLAAWIPLLIMLLLLFHYIEKQEKTVPVLALVALQIYVFFSIPQFSQEEMFLYSGIYQPTAGAVTGAARLVILGEVAFLLGFQGLLTVWGRRPNIFDEILPQPSPNWAPGLIAYSVPALAVYMLNNLRPDYIPISIRFAVSQLFNVYLALVLVLYLAYRFRQPRMIEFAFVLMAAMSLIGFIQGAMGHIVNPIIILFMCTWIWGRAIRIRWVLLILVAIIIINPVKNQFRTLEWVDKDVSSLEKVERRLGSWGLAFQDVWSGDSTDSNILATASRTDDLLPLAQAVDLVPSEIPYLYGEGMEIILVYWVPRIFWPTKTSSTDLLYNRYAVEFGHSSLEGILTSTTAASAFTEGYWNFGWFGVGFYLLALGAILGFFFGNNGKSGDVSAIICMAYYAGNMLFLQPLLLMLTSMITFTVGVCLAMLGLGGLSKITSVR